MADLLAPKPFYRSVLCWLGVPGMLFLLWVWFVSQKEWRLTWTDRLSTTAFVYEPGVVGILRTTLSPEYGVTHSDVGFQMHSQKVDPRDLDYFGWSLSWSSTTSHDHPWVRISRLSVPLWLLVPVYTTAWLGSVLWWQRRKIRLLKASSSAPPP